MPLVHVKIQWPTGIEPLPDDAITRVTVEDATRADASSVVVGESVLHSVDTTSPSTAVVEVGDIDPSGYYIVRLHVDRQGRGARDVEKGDIITTQSYPVLTRGHGDHVVLEAQQI